MTDTNNFHRLLKRQIDKHLKSIDVSTPEMQNFLTAINEAYASFNNDHKQLERTLELSSNELFKANEKLNKYAEELEGKVKERTAELEQSKNFLDAILNAVANPIFVKDEDHRFLMANDVMCDMLGKHHTELLGKTDFDFFPKEEADVFRANDDIVFKTREENINEEQLTDKDGFQRTILTKKTLFSNGQKEDFLVGTITDLTERKKMEEQMREQNVQLMSYSNELAKINKELDQFAYIVSHDLKAPLRAIVNLSMWIEEEIEEKMSDDTKKNFDMLRGRVQRMEDLINGILEYSRVGRLKSNLALLSINDFLKEIIENLDPPENFKFNIQENMPKSKFDKILLEQVFSNLISNAVKYNNNPNPEISIEFKDETNYYQFSVADNGGGIDKQFHDKIFTIFQTLQSRDKFESTGVGLAIVKKIVEDTGGKIWLESEKGKGTKFIFNWTKNN
jgi:PAS domain S-box-containing protein